MLVLQATYGASTGEPVAKPRYIPFTSHTGVLIEEADGYWLLSPLRALNGCYCRSYVHQYIVAKNYGDVAYRMSEAVASIRRLNALVGETK